MRIAHSAGPPSLPGESKEESACKSSRARSPLAAGSPLGLQPSEGCLQPAEGGLSPARESPPDGSRSLREAEEGPPSHSLTQTDLALVRAQLRAIATQPPAGAREAEAERGGSSSRAVAAAAQEIEIETSALVHQLGGGGVRGVSSAHRAAEQGVCAAAIETCLWFGLALGEPPRNREQQQQQRQQQQQQQHDQQASLHVHVHVHVHAHVHVHVHAHLHLHLHAHLHLHLHPHLHLHLNLHPHLILPLTSVY